MPRSGVNAVNGEVLYGDCSFYRLVFLPSFLWDAGAFGPIIAFGQ